MTPKEKAHDIIDKYIQLLPYYSKDSNYKRSVNSALIAVDECINASTSFLSCEVAFEKSKEYWYKVKEEIIKLKTPSNEVRSY